MLERPESVAAVQKAGNELFDINTLDNEIEDLEKLIAAGAKELEKKVDREFIKYRRELCRIHANEVEKAPLPLQCALDARFAAGYQMGLIEAAKLLRKLGKK